MSEPTSEKERPILFSAPMVRAILDGRKTQTRRIVEITHRTPGLAACLEPADPSWVRPKFGAELCPYGVPGDHLWVRETHYVWSAGYKDGSGRVIAYRSTEPDSPCTWTPSIHMPRWASRITLEITDARVERLQEITRGDCMQEGCPFQNMANGPDPRDWYAQLWGQINGAGSWDANPWVWVVAFKRLP